MKIQLMGGGSFPEKIDGQSLAEDEYKNNFVSAVVPPGEIGVKFNDVGALEDVKKALNKLVILPVQRRELFSHRNLLWPCKGILLFGPPGTGKKNLCIAIVCRPVQELLEEENKGNRFEEISPSRPLNLDDFIHSKAKPEEKKAKAIPVVAASEMGAT